MTVKELLDDADLQIAKQSFSDLDKKNMKRDSRHLLAVLFNCSFNELFLHYSAKLKSNQNNIFDQQYSELIKGKPLAYLLEEQGFYKHTFFVDKRVLIPRMETELLVEEVLKYFSGLQDFKFVDFGTGSGCIAISLLKELINSKAWGVDSSELALQVAKKNANNLNVNTRLNFIHAEVKSAFVNQGSESFDFIVANPPYIGSSDYVHPFVKRFEPAFALWAGSKGLEFLLLWAKKAIILLKPRAYYFFEFGDQQKNLLEPELKLLFSEVYFIKDLQGIYRIAVCKKA